MFYIDFNVSFVYTVSLRAANFFLINLILAFADFHLSFLIDILGFFLIICCRVHRSFELMSCFCLSFHVFIIIVSRIFFFFESNGKFLRIYYKYSIFFSFLETCSLFIIILSIRGFHLSVCFFFSLIFLSENHSTRYLFARINY